MGNISVINCVVFLSICLYFATVKAKSYEVSNNQKSKEASPLWFGQRIGRKKRNPGEKVYRNDKEQDSSGLLDVLRESPLVVVAVNEGKPHNFTPRLGRESGETLSLSNWIEEPDFSSEPDPLFSRSNNLLFDPRLGRNTNSPFSPRLGRDNETPLK